MEAADSRWSCEFAPCREVISRAQRRDLRLGTRPGGDRCLLRDLHRDHRERRRCGGARRYRGVHLPDGSLVAAYASALWREQLAYELARAVPDTAQRTKRSVNFVTSTISMATESRSSTAQAISIRTMTAAAAMAVAIAQSFNTALRLLTG